MKRTRKITGVALGVAAALAVLAGCGRTDTTLFEELEGVAPGSGGTVPGPPGGAGGEAPFDCNASAQCPSGFACDPGGRCVRLCTPSTCGQLGKNCGTMPDGCGGTLYCGSCETGSTCGAQVPNVCGVGRCQPSFACDDASRCGIVSDGCGGIVNCPPCTCQPEQKFCAGICIENVPLVGCGEPGCNPCPRPPLNGIATCSASGECAVQCIFGYQLLDGGSRCEATPLDAGGLDASPESGIVDAAPDATVLDSGGGSDAARDATGVSDATDDVTGSDAATGSPTDAAAVDAPSTDAARDALATPG